MTRRMRYKKEKEKEGSNVTLKRETKKQATDEPTWMCYWNPFMTAIRIQEPVIPGEPLIKC